MREFSLIVLLSLLSVCAQAQGGPPLATDDPGTPGDGKWEINGAITTEITRSRQNFGLPALDFNYGVGEHVQLKFETEADLIHAMGSATRAGIGYSKVGVKWRFVDEEKSGVAVSVYPQLKKGCRRRQPGAACRWAGGRQSPRHRLQLPHGVARRQDQRAGAALDSHRGVQEHQGL